MKLQCKVSAALGLVLMLALASIAQTATAPAPTTLSSEEREAALKSLQATHDEFLKSIAGLSEKQWRFKAAPDRWSIAEVAEHITISESTFLATLQNQVMTAPADPAKRAEVKGKDEMVLKMVPDRTQKRQAPENLRPTNRWSNRDKLTKAFEANRKATMDYVKTTTGDLRDHFAPHGAPGLLDGYQWILFISAHSERHTKQIGEVKADPSFPKE
jgi:uncharacterized damage-inducible protein DinB